MNAALAISPRSHTELHLFGLMVQSNKEMSLHRHFQIQVSYPCNFECFGILPLAHALTKNHFSRYRINLGAIISVVVHSLGGSWSSDSLVSFRVLVSDDIVKCNSTMRLVVEFYPVTFFHL